VAYTFRPCGYSQAAKERQKPIPVLGEPESVLRILACHLAQAITVPLIAQQRTERCFNIVRVIGVDQEAVLPMPNDLGRRTAARCDDRRAEGHCFNEDQSETLAETWHDED
jgi:hypothetical protein